MELESLETLENAFRKLHHKLALEMKILENSNGKWNEKHLKM